MSSAGRSLRPAPATTAILEPGTVSPYRNEEYTVAWICALSIELEAARLMLEKEHGRCKHKSRADNNTYVLGELYGHKVVIIVLPSIGTASAATSATQIRFSFKNVEFAFLVGISGGLPGYGSDGRFTDIRLGDVIVASPEGIEGGVIQYDRGTSYGGRSPDRQFLRKGRLPNPPRIFESAIRTIQSQEKHIKLLDVIEKKLEEKFADPEHRRLFRPQGKDLLFRADYNHRVNVVEGKPCEKAQCDTSKIVPRQPRKDRNPVVHYGTIACGNTVIRDAEMRDRIKADLNALCVEMEAAGVLLSELPCQVIRGVCDYTDTHKNDNWQSYAAIAAAAYASIVLSVMATIRVPSGSRSRAQRPEAQTKFGVQSRARIRNSPPSSQSTPRFDHIRTRSPLITLKKEAYTVAWACFTKDDQKAACILLDQRHGIPLDGLPGQLARNDGNEYSFGDANGHNVVVVFLEKNPIFAMLYLKDSFEKLKHLVLLGAGTALVEKKATSPMDYATGSFDTDIRPGDVIVAEKLFSSTHKESKWLAAIDNAQWSSELRFAVSHSMDHEGEYLESLYEEVIRPAILRTGSVENSRRSRQTPTLHPLDSSNTDPRNLNPIVHLGYIVYRLDDVPPKTADTWRNAMNEVGHRDFNTSAVGILDLDPILRHHSRLDDDEDEPETFIRKCIALALPKFMPVIGVCEVEYTEGSAYDATPGVGVLPSKRPLWRKYAVMAAAAYARELLHHIPRPEPEANMTTPDSGFYADNGRSRVRDWVTGTSEGSYASSQFSDEFSGSQYSSTSILRDPDYLPGTYGERSYAGADFSGRGRLERQPSDSGYAGSSSARRDHTTSFHRYK
ncbi:purine and uridine phosphorylase [Ascobolus immersus RN42]|uniref:Purine and uridine phosphorylase n=1 Tax=Ascobolus immersus RN42 TaxID=1160509 RepID=A0A3N4HYS9_ASCIM|nr:purine and uridine phosphorylase [Ascobolus immersus RN42]